MQVPLAYVQVVFGAVHVAPGGSASFVGAQAEVFFVGQVGLPAGKDTLHVPAAHVATTLHASDGSVPYSHSRPGAPHATPFAGALAGHEVESPPLVPLVPLEPLVPPPSPVPDPGAEVVLPPHA